MFYTRHLLRLTPQQTAFTPKQLFHQTPFTPRALCTSTLLHQATLTPEAFYTKQLLCQAPFTPNTFYTRNHLNQATFTPSSFYTRNLLHKAPFRSLLPLLLQVTFASPTIGICLFHIYAFQYLSVLPNVVKETTVTMALNIRKKNGA